MIFVRFPPSALRGLFAAYAALATAAPAAVAECNRFTTTAEIGECLVEEFHKADAELGEAYKELLRDIDGNDTISASERARRRATLVKSERAGVAYKDAWCDGVIAFQWQGGSGQGNAVTFCALDLTKKRAAELRDPH